ncbi:MAG: hypothetical protein IJI26_04100, partial [Clostridia bacterium]|nr:hypothetical protein [Clostridia bacterium]
MQILICRGVGGKAKGSTKGTGNSQQGTGKAAHGMLQVGVFKPVMLAGTTVSRATLHNEDFIR